MRLLSGEVPALDLAFGLVGEFVGAQIAGDLALGAAHVGALDGVEQVNEHAGDRTALGMLFGTLRDFRDCGAARQNRRGRVSHKNLLLSGSLASPFIVVVENQYTRLRKIQ